VLVFALVLSRVVIADDPPASQPSNVESQVIDVSDKAAVDGAMNKECVVEGVVESAAWSQSGKVMTIRFKNSNESKFIAAVFEKKKEDFNSAFSGDVTKALPGAKVRIRGTIKDYRGKPEIVIDTPAALTIVEPPPAPATQPDK
jgi:DNA/RNA endonuclease YhcR with UshA esterase domain